MKAMTPGNQARPTFSESFAAPALLLGAGLLLSVSTNLSKVAQSLDIQPLSYLTWSLAGALLLLVMLAPARYNPVTVNRRSLEYYLVTGSLTVAATNLIFFVAVSHLGVSFVALLLSLPPLLTYLGALLLGMESFCWWRVGGVFAALSGTAWLVIQQWVTADAALPWIVVALFGILLLSAGNLYRTLRWPPGASADSLVPGMLLVAVLTLAGTALLSDWTLSVPQSNPGVAVLIVIQAAVYAGQFQLFLLLQRIGGPVFLSLTGAVSALFGVPVATLLLGEPMLAAVVPSALCIAAGIGCMLIGVRHCHRRGATVPVRGRN